MVVHVHGLPGTSLGAAAQQYGSSAKRGAFFERCVGAAVQTWLENLPGVYHLFHDLVRLDHVTGAGLKPLSLGQTNIDHLVLTGTGWLLIDAKGCGVGVLGTDSQGKGRLVTPSGEQVVQPWMDSRRSYSQAGIAHRLTDGGKGQLVWVIPEETDIDEASASRARIFER
ncbi:nuclease-related domain-containing protein [Nocardiopsis suaedae]|uniref:Nuclease-related domain-containing protein n=1 Tax=Nocardiopsis suaedae TaxID=3018444 RepID=A0ABT4TJA8_9ACTN|nr:nuclease-related domain-containing protein [Nocardiopsis suaedae]MDA2804797.1 nuclease-related domain-containing protein [Nocardiopsis suaedae]